MRKSRCASHDDALWLASRLRDADQRELLAVGVSPRQALVSGYQDSVLCKTICNDRDEPVAMYGVANSTLQGMGHPWLLAADGIEDVSITFLKRSRQAVGELHAAGPFPLLLNYAASFNTLHLTWLKWCGFTFSKSINVNGTEFQGFYRTQNV